MNFNKQETINDPESIEVLECEELSELINLNFKGLLCIFSFICLKKLLLN